MKPVIPVMKLSHILLLSLSYFQLRQVNADNEVTVLKTLLATYKDWKPRGIVDIGANKGGWTTSVLESLLPNVQTFMIEASPEHTAELEAVQNKFGKDLVDFKIAVMSANDGDKVEFYGFGGTGDSMFKENTKFYADQKPVIRETTKLDTLVQHMEFIDYVKLDVQGAELLVLGGASETLAKTTFVQLEVSVVEYNQGGACWFEMDDVLRKHGFYFYDSGDYSRNSGLFKTKALAQFDVLYIKPTSPYLPQQMRSNMPNFCGSSRSTTSTNIAALKGTATTNLSSDYNINNTNHHIALMGCFFTAFTLGYIVSMLKNKSKADRKTA